MAITLPTTRVKTMTDTVFLNSKVLDNGLAYLKAHTNSIAVVDYNYVAGDSYATVRGTSNVNIIAEQTGITASTITLADQGTLGRKATTTACSPTAVKTSSGTTGYLRFVLFDTVNTDVLAVIDSANDQIITIGNPVDIDALVVNFNQPISI